jgi:hypothetical protein
MHSFRSESFTRGIQAIAWSAPTREIALRANEANWRRSIRSAASKKPPRASRRSRFTSKPRRRLWPSSSERRSNSARARSRSRAPTCSKRTIVSAKVRSSGPETEIFRRQRRRTGRSHHSSASGANSTVPSVSPIHQVANAGRISSFDIAPKTERLATAIEGRIRLLTGPASPRKRRTSDSFASVFG